MKADKKRQLVWEQKPAPEEIACPLLAPFLHLLPTPRTPPAHGLTALGGILVKPVMLSWVAARFSLFTQDFLIQLLHFFEQRAF